MKKLFAIPILILALLTGCVHQNMNSGQEETAAPATTIVWTELSAVGDDSFEGLMMALVLEDLPYIKAGELVRFGFSDGMPDTVELRDYVLREDGSAKYSAPGGGGLYMDVPAELADGECSFEMQTNFASYLSSYSGDYLPGATIRGLRLICTYGDETREYGFIFRSDAGVLLALETGGERP